jgi:hypothetical protein
MGQRVSDCLPRGKRWSKKHSGIGGYSDVAILVQLHPHHELSPAAAGQPQNQELPKEEQQARKEKMPSKFHIRTIQTMDCVRSLIEHNESRKTAFKAGKKEDEMEDVSLDGDVNSSSNTGVSGIDVEKGRQTSQHSDNERTSTVLFLSFWRKQELENTECSICLQRYRLDDTICVSKVAECDHVFHQACVSEWLSKHNHCPLCRVDLMSETRSINFGV